MVVFGEDGVSVAAGVIVVARLGGVPHRGAPVVLIQLHERQHARRAAQAAPIAEVAPQEAAHVPAA